MPAVTTAGQTLDVAPHLRAAMLLKERVVKRDGLGADIGTLLDLRHDGVPIGVVRATRSDPQRREDLDALTAIIALTDTDEVAHISDSHIWRADAGAAMPGPYRPGRLAQWFADGNPNVSEGLVVVARTRDGRGGQATAAYRCEGRQVIWERNPVPWDSYGGDVPDAIGLGFQHQTERPGPALPVPAVAMSLGYTCVSPVLQRPGRNEPCPCESGRKSKQCCWR